MTTPAESPRRFDLWGVPFDGGSTLGRPGSRYAPARIRESLGWITQRVQDGVVYSLETDALHHIGDDLIIDRGDVEVTPFDLETTIDACSAAVSESVRAGRVPIVLGGDDSLFFPVVRGLHDATEGSVGVVHFDAHLDLLDRNPHQGSLSQSSGMRRSLELDRVAPATCIQVGSRHFNFPSSGGFKREHGLRHISSREFQALGPAAAAEAILERVGDTDHLFLSFDIDSIDPAFAPGSGAHEPGGLTSTDALEVVRLLAPHCDGLALTEVNPLVDLAGATTTLAAYLLYHFAVFGSHAPIVSDRPSL
ncbi:MULTISPECIES: arginase family protein [unclassified Rathayibacter]|uniref:arginase family protein n=1 Tax=unclassified Rathayibacter TaxID=2609250 RepID=UPI0006F8C30B|nr:MULTISPECIES: arginase family protein [unclassified Rathayibacter]KQQ06230.1 arginase [Rathayibacter sp. Leaf294]KQS14085.1 arginase [Rathayibacter sp. Leaf185]